MSRKPKIVKTDIAHAPASEHLNFDGWANFFSGMGMLGRDRSRSSVFVERLTTRDEQEALWRCNDMGAHAVEKIPGEMFSKGFDLHIEDPEKEKEPTKDPVVDPKKEDAFPPKPGATDGPPGAPPPTVLPMPKMPKPIEEKDKATKELVSAMMKQWDALKGHERFLTSWHYKRAFGGGAIYIGVNDGQRDLSKPVNMDKVRSVDFLNVFTPRECVAASYYADPTAENYGMPELYRLVPEIVPGPMSASGNWAGTQGTKPKAGKSTFYTIHESRLIIFSGPVTSRKARLAKHGWGDSVYDRVLEAIQDYGEAFGGTSALLQKFGNDVVKIKGLAETMGADGETLLRKRMELIAMCKSVIRGVIIDSEEEFEQPVVPVAGLPDLLEKFMQRLAAAFGEPVTVLMGQSPAGLAATGDADVRGWYDTIASMQEHELMPELQYLFELMFHANLGPAKGIEPAKWSIVFRKLWKLDDLQMSTVRLNQSTVDKNEIDGGVVTPEEVATSRHGGEEWSSETHIDYEGRKKNADVASKMTNPMVHGGPIDPTRPHNPPPVPPEAKAPAVPPAPKYPPSR